MGFWGAVGIEALSTSVGALNSAIKTLTSSIFNLTKSGIQMVIGYHKESIAFAREAGLTAKQADAYTQVLTSRARELGIKYGIAAEQVQNLERNLAKATGRVLMLSNAEAERMIQINKLVGEETVNKFTEDIMVGMGGQLSTVQNAVSKAYFKAAKSGLAAQKMAEKVAQNLGMANRLSFRNGIDGVTRMAMLSEKLSINMQSVEAAAGQFLEIDKAIENAAKLQMLGGSAAVMGGNPLTMAYEANYDPEAFAERMSKALASYATFDASKGYATINGMNMDFVRNIAQAMGISTEEASRIAKKRSEVNYKENRYGTTFSAIAGGDQEKRDFLLNKSTIGKNGQLELNGKDIRYYQTGAGAKELQKMMAFEGKSEDELLRDMAMSLTSIDEVVKGVMTSLSGMFADELQKTGALPKIKEHLGEIGRMLIRHAEPIAKNISKMVNKLMGMRWEDTKKKIDNILAAVSRVATWLTKDWKILLTAAIVPTILKSITGAFVGHMIAKQAAKATARSLASMFPSIAAPAAASTATAAGGAAAGGTIASAGGAAATAGGTIASAGTARGAAATARTARSARMAALSRNISNGFKSVTTGLKNTGSVITGGFKENVTALKDVRAAYKIERTVENGSRLSSIKAGAREMSKVRANGALFSNASKLAKGTGVLTAIFAGIEAFGAYRGYSKNKASLNEALQTGQISQEQYNKEIRGAQDNRNKGYGSAIGGVAGAALGSFLGPLGTVAGGVIGSAVGGWIGKNWNNIKDGAKAAGKWLADSARDAGKFMVNAGVKIANGSKKLLGAAGKAGLSVAKFLGNSAIAGLNKVSAIFTPLASRVKAQPVGGKEYVYTPNGSRSSNVGPHKITVNDFNINITGTIRLEAGSSLKSIDAKDLLKNNSFLSSIKDTIKEAINRDMNGGRVMNDLAARRGQTHSSSIIGK